MRRVEEDMSSLHAKLEYNIIGLFLCKSSAFVSKFCNIIDTIYGNLMKSSAIITNENFFLTFFKNITLVFSLLFR